MKRFDIQIQTTSFLHYHHLMYLYIQVQVQVGVRVDSRATEIKSQHDNDKKTAYVDREQFLVVSVYHDKFKSTLSARHVTCSWK